MSPFAAGTWSQIATPPFLGPSAGSRVVTSVSAAYNAALNIIIAGRTCSGAVLFFAPGDFIRSVDNGQTWTQTYADPGGATGPNVAPVAVAFLRDPVSGANRFVAIVQTFTFQGTTARGIKFQVHVGNATGTAWTPGQILADLPDDGANPVAGAISQIVTRPRAHPSDPLEHYVFLKANRVTGPLTTIRGCYRSTDLGATWTPVSDPGDFAAGLTVAGRVLISASLSSLVGSGTGRSEDGGSSWQPASPAFGASVILAFGGGPVLACQTNSNTLPESTRVSCDDARSWPPGQAGPSFGLPEGGVGANVMLLSLDQWEVLMGAAKNPLGTFTILYSDTGGETEFSRADLDLGTGIVAQVFAGVKLADGRPVVFVGIDSVVWRSSDVPTGSFGSRIYCVLAPAPGVGVPGFPAPCGDFYNPCPQECPADPAQPEGLVLPIPIAVTLGDSTPYGDLELEYGVDAAIYGGAPNILIPIPILGRPAGCGATFVNNPCAAEVCP